VRAGTAGRSDPAFAARNLGRLLVTPHAHLITLKDSFVGYVLPSKVHACIASGRPFSSSEVSSPMYIFFVPRRPRGSDTIGCQREMRKASGEYLRHSRLRHLRYRADF
jgi:hypothetical protein